MAWCSRNTGSLCLAHHDGVLGRSRFEKITEKTHILFLFLFLQNHVWGLLRSPNLDGLAKQLRGGMGFPV